jgi:beta-lactamase class A
LIVSTIAAALTVAGAALPLRASQTKGPMDTLTSEITKTVSGFRGQMGVAAINLKSGDTIAVNADTRFPTASTIKTAVMVEVWQQIAEGRLSLDTSVPLVQSSKVGGSGVLRDLHPGLALSIGDLLSLMIVLSDNTATNMLVDKVGTARVNARLEALGLTETKLFRPTFRDGRADVLPELEKEFGLGMTTPREMARLMALIAEEKIVSRDASIAMLATLRRQQDRAMIPRLIARDDLEIGNKTGTDEEKHAGPDGIKRHVRADAAIVTGPNLSYVIAIYARQIEDRNWGIENDALTTGARISKMVFDAFSSSR